ncbi:MAG TPA: hypothetical protein VIV11_05710 [Kofleriaceae bacterium]
MRGLALVAVLWSAPAAAEPAYSLSADVDARLGMSSIYPRLVVTGARRSWDRLQLGVNLGVGSSPGLFETHQSGEVGIWLYPSRSIDLLLGWRIGHAYLYDTHGPASLSVHSAIVETFATMELHLGPVELRVTPLLITGYRTGAWLLLIGPQIGVAKWL